MWALAGPAIVLAPLSARASVTDLTPCSGAWEGTAEDPWEPGPYTVQLALTGGAERCATVTYVGLCTSRWVDCTVGDGWVTAREVLVDPGNCAPGVIQVRCPNANALEVRWEGEPGVMEATLHRAAREPTASPIRPTNQAPTKPDAPASPPTAERPKVPPRTTGCGCAGAWVLIPGIAWRRRRRSATCQARRARVRGQ